MLTIDALKEYGANTEEGLGRCFGNEALYLRLVGTVPGEPNFDKLAEAVGQNDLDTAFEMAHALKGAMGNLSLTPIAEPVSEMTELLRARTEMDYSELLEKVLAGRDALKVIAEA
ncbi:MAG: Hpt domain-containing protein [Lachnospiraceae bacterium]|nr:Hpt domain-containing protein [Lachnospiraceae bacterium]